MSKIYRLLNFKDLGDERGKLVVIEGNQDIPFEIARAFYIYGSDSTVGRGQHAVKDAYTPRGRKPRWGLLPMINRLQR